MYRSFCVEAERPGNADSKVRFHHHIESRERAPAMRLPSPNAMHALDARSAGSHTISTHGKYDLIPPWRSYHSDWSHPTFYLVYPQPPLPIPRWPYCPAPAHDSRHGEHRF